MNFEFSADQMQLKDIARKFLEKEESVKRARNILEGDASYDEDLWSQVIEMGFTATAIPEEYGGLGLGYLELCVIAEELGRSLAPTPFSSSVYLATEAILNFGDDSVKQAMLPAFASGEKIGAFAHSESNTSPTEANINCTYSDGTLSLIIGKALLKLASSSTCRVIKCTITPINNDNSTKSRHIFIKGYEPVAKIVGIPTISNPLPSCEIQAVLFTRVVLCSRGLYFS